MSDLHHTPDYWLGYLAHTVADTARELPRPHRQRAEVALEKFLKSKAATDELAAIVRKEIRR